MAVKGDKVIQDFELEPSWLKALGKELNEPYMEQLNAFLEIECANSVPVYPPQKWIFNAFQQTPYDKVKVVIVGQDPYHGPNQAHGLCFSVPKGVTLPPSLQNIFKELHADLDIPIPSHGCLISWAEQGVLLLNTTLTVRKNEPLSHHGKGWEIFTDAVVRALIAREEPVIFVLWGKFAQEKCRYLNLQEGHHTVLKAAHPSPFSAYKGFFGCRHFSKINEILISQHSVPINWNLH